MIFALAVLIISAAVALYLSKRCDHYFGVPYIVDDEVHRTCYKCGKVKLVHEFSIRREK